jgi:hypothetical protein
MQPVHRRSNLLLLFYLRRDPQGKPSSKASQNVFMFLHSLVLDACIVSCPTFPSWLHHSNIIWWSAALIKASIWIHELFTLLTSDTAQQDNGWQPSSSHTSDHATHARQTLHLLSDLIKRESHSTIITEVQHKITKPNLLSVGGSTAGCGIACIRKNYRNKLLARHLQEERHTSKIMLDQTYKEFNWGGHRNRETNHWHKDVLPAAVGYTFRVAVGA